MHVLHKYTNTQRYSRSSQSWTDESWKAKPASLCFWQGAQGLGSIYLNWLHISTSVQNYLHLMFKISAIMQKIRILKFPSSVVVFTLYKWLSQYTSQRRVCSSAMAAAPTHSTQGGVAMCFLHCGFHYPDRGASSKQASAMATFPQGFTTP